MSSLRVDTITNISGGTPNIPGLGGSRLIGEIIMWGSSTIPSGWLECNGQSTSSYPALAALYDNVPDLRGQFIRGWDNGRGVDTGRSLRSDQTDSTRLPRSTEFTTSNPGNHSHSYSRASGPTRNDGEGSGNKEEVTKINYNNRTSGGGGGHTHTIDGGGDDETRPRNVSLMFIVYSG